MRDGKFSVKGSPDKAMTLAEVAGEAYIPIDLPEGLEPGLEETVLLRPRELHVAVRRARLRGRRRRGDGQGEGRPLRRGRRLRPGDQPAADRRPGPRRHRAHDRAGALRAGRLRRGGTARHGHVRGLRAAQRGGDPDVRDGPHRDPVAGQHARRQGRRRGRHDRRDAGDRQRRDRRPASARGHVRQPALHADARVAGDPARRKGSGEGPRATEQGRELGEEGRGPGFGPTTPEGGQL